MNAYSFCALRREDLTATPPQRAARLGRHYESTRGLRHPTQIPKIGRVAVSVALSEARTRTTCPADPAPVVLPSAPPSIGIRETFAPKVFPRGDFEQEKSPAIPVSPSVRGASTWRKRWDLNPYRTGSLGRRGVTEPHEVNGPKSQALHRIASDSLRLFPRMFSPKRAVTTANPHTCHPAAHTWPAGTRRRQPPENIERGVRSQNHPRAHAPAPARFRSRSLRRVLPAPAAASERRSPGTAAG
jgi:hypothetical protein